MEYFITPIEKQLDPELSVFGFVSYAAALLEADALSKEHSCVYLVVEREPEGAWEVKTLVATLEPTAPYVAELDGDNIIYTQLEVQDDRYMNWPIQQGETVANNGDLRQVLNRQRFEAFARLGKAVRDCHIRESAMKALRNGEV